MGSLGSKTQILYFWNSYSKLAIKNYTKGLQSGFPHPVRSSSPDFRNENENKSKRPLLTFVFVLLIFQM